ncbi:uncharacterized protein Triagg1_8800 [Trichoderma aggressivum f. europaeum]|uniref:Uncharacterized protein n=1 Tax=Trichoderma aggressivum f. europaeum TaxID=173218 RepID=A0AAE1M1G8_9HYPO|nr:hypothetical protein Triagg1_8800 [Trichoderma aggressivum f. europaeum]
MSPAMRAGMDTEVSTRTAPKGSFSSKGVDESESEPFSDDGILGNRLLRDGTRQKTLQCPLEGPFCHFNAILQNPVVTMPPLITPNLGEEGAPRAAVDGIDLVCPQVHTKVHMRDLPPPRETRSAAALIGVRDIGHRKSEPVIVSVRGGGFADQQATQDGERLVVHRNQPEPQQSIVQNHFYEYEYLYNSTRQKSLHADN